MSLEQHSLESIWNSDEMRDVRRAMVDGRSVPGCRQCYTDEAAGAISMRMRDNAAFERGGMQNEGLTSIKDLKAAAAANNFRLGGVPAILEADIGSLCNLKCRMCHDGVSSRIAADPVHSAWASDQRTGAAYHSPSSTSRKLGIRPFAAAEKIRAALSTHPRQIKRLYFIGGEPFLARGVADILREAIDSDQSRHIELAIVSNGTIPIPQSWLDLATRFKRVELAVSIDGYGAHYEYIRYPAKWEALNANLQTWQCTRGVHVAGAVTLQAYNALHITDLFRHFDAIGLTYWAYPIVEPRYLSIDVMPAAARRVAAERLMKYAAIDCRPRARDLVLGLAERLQPSADLTDAGLVRDMMLFTNDLDRSRRQSIREVDSEFVSFFERAGYPWIRETVHANESSAPRESVAYAPRSENLDWFQTTIQSLTATVETPLGELLPAFPPEQIQANTIGLSGEAAVRQAFAFYEDVIDAIGRAGSQIGDSWRILDFGACWGRVTRLFLRHVPASNIIGLDVEPQFVDMARKLFGGPQFMLCSALPPTDIETGSLRLITAYSVFSHLSEKAASAWIEEFARVLAPGGFLAFTTRDESFLDYCKSLATQEAQGSYSHALGTLFPDIEAARASYRSGQFVWATSAEVSGGGAMNSSFYGEALIPGQHVSRAYGDHFDLVSERFDGSRYDQRLFVLRRNSYSPPVRS